MIIEKEGTVIETHYYCPPGLVRTHFFIDSMEQRVPDPGTPSGILMRELREREHAAADSSKSPSLPDEEVLDGDEIIDREEFNEFVEEVEKSDTKKKKKQLRSLNKLNKKIEKLVFDDTALKEGELEDEAYEILNKDGFYDEIFPIDYDEEDDEIDRKPLKTLAFYVGTLFLLVGFVIWYIKVIVL